MSLQSAAFHLHLTATELPSLDTYLWHTVGEHCTISSLRVEVGGHPVKQVQGTSLSKGY